MLSASADPSAVPATMATSLYKDCIEASFKYASVEPTRVGILNFAAELDQQCYDWARIWYQPFAGHELQEASTTVQAKFNANRLIIRQELKKILFSDLKP